MRFLGLDIVSPQGLSRCFIVTAISSASEPTTCNASVMFLIGHVSVEPGHRCWNRGGNAGARPCNAETTGAKVSFCPRNNLPSFSAG